MDFNFVLGRDYVYVMEAVMSKLFQVMHFPLDGNIDTIDELCITLDHSTSLCILSVRVDSTMPRVNYVASYPLFLIATKKEHLFSCSYRMLF